MWLHVDRHRQLRRIERRRRSFRPIDDVLHGVESTAALRAPSRAAFAVLFHEWNANPKSMIPKTRHEEEGGDDGELDRRGSALAVDPTAPGAGMREPRAAVERVRGSLEHWRAL